MNILLLRPHPGNDRFGLGPFFQVEPLGLEYVGAVLRSRGDNVTIADLRFRPGLGTWISRTRPRIIDKDAGVDDCIEAVRVAREQRYGINGNFLIDHDWGEDDFSELWEFVARYNLQRAGFTILTPLPGTDFYNETAPRMGDQPWSNFDMHHLLWEPRLGAARFFELYAETWRRSILNTSGEKSIYDWMRQVRPAQIPYIVHVLWRTQRMMKPAAYLREHKERRIVRHDLPRARQPSEISTAVPQGN